MKKTMINDHCAGYACAGPEDVRQSQENQRTGQRTVHPDDLIFDRYRFTVAWEKAEGQ